MMPAPCVTVQLSEVVGNEEAVKRLRVIADEGNMPNLILSVCVRVLVTASSRRAADVLVFLNTTVNSGTTWNW